MKIESYKPSCDILASYIESFYVITRSASEKASDVIVFPHTNTGLSLLKNSRLTHFKDSYYEFDYAKNVDFVSVLAFGYNEPVHIKYSGSFKEITIVFKPLGINAFLENDFDDYTSKINLGQFIPFSDYKIKMLKILDSDDTSIQLKLLEQYWKSKLIGFSHPFLIRAISEMESGNFTVKQFASDNSVSVKTFIYQFKKHIGRTPIQHQKIIRFRNSINMGINNSSGMSLTSIALDSGYFDQSHFIRDFKNLTGKKPKDFFRIINLHDKSQQVNIIS